ncbi:tetratricopeptide repeat protein [Streptomyces hyaluromycini]|uniref:Tetratricopeptide repeat protein n=1 Tax=Streptomyces hyaluromycini TaxID=1377993 RepID=A0ABV1WPU4_9ACTN
MRWGQPGGTAALPFEGAGFPVFADEADRGEFEHLRGELSVVSTASSAWVLDCRPVWPAPGRDSARPWAGASGAAIFCGDRLVGVAVEDSRTMDWRRLYAVPVHEALSLPGFADLVTRHGHPGTTITLDEVIAQNTVTGTGKDSVMWPVVPATIPALATAFQPRSALRERIDAAWANNGSVVLAQEPTRVLSGGGGVGKTQMAAVYATDAVRDGTDLVLWVTAADVQQVITQYAQTAALLKLPGISGQDLEADARLLHRWLSTTRRRWLVVLDDITDPAAVDPWWPVSRTDTGRALATTRRRDAHLTGNGRIRVEIDVYTATESEAYLQERLAAENMGRLLDDRMPQLVEALGHLPLGLGMAAAHMINEELTSSEYLRRFNDRRARLEEVMPGTADTEGYHRPTRPTRITAALLLSLDAVQAADTTGLATTVLRLTALLDPAGHPHALWNAPAFLNHLATRYAPPPQDDTTTPPAQVTAEQAHAVLRLLHRYALLTCDTRAEPRAVGIHALTARAVRETTPAIEISALTVTAADGLLQIWPDPNQHHADHAAVLRANTGALFDHTGDQLWHSRGHVVLYRAGSSLINAGLAASACTYWHRMAADSERLLGAEHPGTLTARANLTTAYRQAGRIGEAIELLEQVTADHERLLGAAHPHTLTTRGHLAASYRQAGRTGEAIAIEERVLADSERLLGAEHPTTLTIRANLATAHQQAGRTSKAIELLEQVTADHERLLGAAHPHTLTTRGNLATAYQQAGRTSKAIELLERVAADSERVLGAEHPETLTARGNLAALFWRVGRTGEAIELQEQGAADHERLLGAEHPHTLTVRSHLAASYRQAGRTREAVELQEEVLADSERVLGVEHPDTLTARGNLAISYRQAGRIGEAIAIEERVLADSERMLGAEHPDTLITRRNLATSYWRAGRTGEAIELQEQLAADSERLLGSEHPDTLIARGNLAAFYWRAGRTREAIAIEEQVLADSERLLGAEHPDTLTARANLAAFYQWMGRTGEATESLEQAEAVSDPSQDES